MNPDKPTKVQEDWREEVRALGSIISAAFPVEIDHVIGRTAQVKIDYVSTNIGHWYILPLTKAEHQLRTLNRTEFVKRHGSERELFKSVCRFYLKTHDELPFSDEIYNAIQEYHK